MTQKTAINWTDYSSGPIRFRNIETGKVGWHCEKVSDGCRHCYSETLNQKWGTLTPYNPLTTKSMEVFFDDKMAGTLYTKIKEPHAKVFMFDMTDFFGAFVPDYIRAAAWCVMLDLPQHVFQVLTKRPESAVLWAERFVAARASDEFKALVEGCKNQRVKAALQKDYAEVWASHIWMGTSVEDARVVKRIETLRKVPATVRFLSCEPLIGSIGKSVDLSGIHWIIVGGESGGHLKPGDPRWLNQEWAREIRDMCVNQGVAFWMKQDSGHRTELRTYLVEEDGSRWKWQQMPNDFIPAVNIDTGELWEPKTYRGYRGVEMPDYEWGSSVAFAVYPTPQPEASAVETPVTPEFVELPTNNPVTAVRELINRTKVVNFHDVKDHWNPQTRQWDNDQYVYIGRFNSTYNLPESPFHNPFKLTVDTPENRAAVLEQYRAHITKRIADGFLNPNVLYGKILVCWCSPKVCHGDVLVEILHPTMIRKPAEVSKEPVQLSLF